MCFYHSILLLTFKQAFLTPQCSSLFLGQVVESETFTVGNLTLTWTLIDISITSYYSSTYLSKNNSNR